MSNAVSSALKDLSALVSQAIVWRMTGNTTAQYWEVSRVVSVLPLSAWLCLEFQTTASA
jgi:hypothetical protein